MTTTGNAGAFWRIAARNLWRSKRRSLVTGLAVMLGVAGLALAAGYVYRVANYMTIWSIYHNQTGHVSVYREQGLEQALVRPRTHTMPVEEWDFLRAQAAALEARGIAVERVVPFLHGTGLAGNGCKTIPFAARGIEPGFEGWMRSHPAVLKWTPELAAVKAGKGLDSPGLPASGVVAGKGLLDLLSKDQRIFSGGRVEPFVPDCQDEAQLERLRLDANVQLASTGFQGEFGVVDAEVVGSFSSGYSDVDASILAVPLPLLQSLYSTTNVTYGAVYLADPDRADEAAVLLAEGARAKGYDWDTYAYDDKAIAPVLVGTLRFLYTLGGAIALVLCGLTSLTILNTMTIAVAERTREMGMLRSLGFRRKELTGLFVKEATVVVATAAVAGVAFSYAAAAAINALDIRFKPPGVADTMQFLIVLAPWFLVVIAVVLAVLATVATRIAVRRKVGEPAARLLASGGA